MKGLKRAAFKGGVCRTDSCLPPPVPASLNECCALNAAEGEHVEGATNSGWKALVFHNLDLYHCLVEFGKPFCSSVSEQCSAAPVCSSLVLEESC